MSDSSTPPPPDSGRLSPAELRRLVVGKVRRIPGVPPAERDDVAQEATLRAWRSLPTYETARGSFLDWLGAVVLNTVRDIMRRIRRRPEAACDELPEVATDCEAGPEAQVGAAEVIALARRIADEIPADLRRVLLMKAEGLTKSQIAARLRLPETTVQGRLARAQHHAEQTVERWKAARRLKPHDLIALALLWMVLSGEPSAEAAMANPPSPPPGPRKKAANRLRDYLIFACCCLPVASGLPVLASKLGWVGSGRISTAIAELLGRQGSAPSANQLAAVGAAPLSAGYLPPLSQAPWQQPAAPLAASPLSPLSQTPWQQSAMMAAPAPTRMSAIARTKSAPPRADELASVASILSLIRQGRLAQAQAEMAAFDRAFPTSIYALRVRGLLAEARAKAAAP